MKAECPIIFSPMTGTENFLVDPVRSDEGKTIPKAASPLIQKGAHNSM